MNKIRAVIVGSNQWIVECARGIFQDIAKGILYCTENRERLGVQTRKSVIRYSYENVAIKYLELMKAEIGE